MLAEQLDHLVLTVANLEATCRFYSNVLGMQIIEFAGGRKALQFGARKLNLHQAGAEFPPHALQPTPGSVDICFLTSTPMEEVIGHLTAHRIDIIEGPIRRTGAAGPILSVYFRDPDGNLIELANQLSPTIRTQNHEA